MTKRKHFAAVKQGLMGGWIIPAPDGRELSVWSVERGWSDFNKTVHAMHDLGISLGAAVSKLCIARAAVFVSTTPAISLTEVCPSYDDKTMWPGRNIVVLWPVIHPCVKCQLPKWLDAEIGRVDDVSLAWQVAIARWGRDGQNSGLLAPSSGCKCLY